MGEVSIEKQKRVLVSRATMLPVKERLYNLQTVPRELIAFAPLNEAVTLSEYACRMIAWHVELDVMVKAINYYFDLKNDTDGWRPWQFITHLKNTEKWKPLIEKYRAEYNSDLKRIPIANKAYRMEVLQGALQRVLDSKKPSPYSISELVELASKEVGEFQPMHQTNIQVNTYANMVLAYEGEEDCKATISTDAKKLDE